MKKYEMLIQYDVVDVDGDYILTPKNECYDKSADAIILNVTGYQLFEALARGLDVYSIIRQFAERYQIEQTIIATDLQEIIDDLTAKKLIKEIE